MLVVALAMSALVPAMGLVAPASAQEPCQPFIDICGTTHEATIRAIADLAIAGGYADGTYRPDASITRAQMATFIVNAFPGAFDLETNAPSPFVDVDPDSTHHDAIVAVSGNIQGYPDGTYRPHEPVTRGQMARFLSIEWSDPAEDTTYGFGVEPSDVVRFSDVRGTTHEASINALATSGIAGGYADDTYRPSSPATRGQMATFFARGLGIVPRVTPAPKYVEPEPITDPAPDLGTYNSVAEFEADVFDTFDTILGTSTEEGMLDLYFDVYDMWWSYQITDAEYVAFLDLWIDVLDSHIDWFAVRTPPSTHQVPFDHFTLGLDQFREGAVMLITCFDCPTAFERWELALDNWEQMLNTWPTDVTLSSTEDARMGRLLQDASELAELVAGHADRSQ